MASTDIGVFEAGTESASPVTSLKRNGATTIWSWSKPDKFAPATTTSSELSSTASKSRRHQRQPRRARRSSSRPQHSTRRINQSPQRSPGRRARHPSQPWMQTESQPRCSPATLSIIATAGNGVADTAALHVDAPPPPPPLPDTRFSELHYDNFGTDTGEAIEVEGPAGTALNGWSIVLYNGDGGVAYNTAPLSGTIPDLTALAWWYTSSSNYLRQDGIQNGPRWLCAHRWQRCGRRVPLLRRHVHGNRRTGGGTHSGRHCRARVTSAPVGQSLQRDANGAWSGPTTATPGGCNNGPPPPPPTNSISFSGRLVHDPALPVGFEDQLFATERDPSNVVIPTTFTWTAETPAIATIDQNGVMRALAEGTCDFRATATDGTTARSRCRRASRVASPTALYAGNAEFGEPADSDASDDFIVRRAQYTFVLQQHARHAELGELQPRGDALRAGGSVRLLHVRSRAAGRVRALHHRRLHRCGHVRGYGIDRGHLARSFDRTVGQLDNAYTYLLLEHHPAGRRPEPGAVGDHGKRPRRPGASQNKEVYIIAGVAGAGHGQGRGHDRDPGERVEGRGHHGQRLRTSRAARTSR